MSAAPDLASPVVGFRAWRIANGKLLSPYVPCCWEGRVLRAECHDANRSLLRGEGWLQEPHASPHPDCRCGIYAYHGPGPRTYFGELWWCEGVIRAWGRLEVHARGIRAEFARVEALGLPAGGAPRLGEAVSAIGRRLGVPVVAADRLPDVAAWLGAPVPESLRPS